VVSFFMPPSDPQGREIIEERIDDARREAQHMYHPTAEAPPPPGALRRFWNRITRRSYRN
jgi:hypothetical protein